MKHISNIIDINKLKIEPTENNSTSADSDATASVINKLFKILRSTFPAFKQAWPTDVEFIEAKRMWLAAFMLAEINSWDKIQHGINKMLLMETDFICSPGKFISLCKPSAKDLGFPTADEAYFISINYNRQFSTYKPIDGRVETIIRHSIDQIGSTYYREMNIENAKKAFKTYYEISVEQFIAGELKPITKAITENQEPHPIDRVKADAARDKCIELLWSKGLANSRRMQKDNL